MKMKCNVVLQVILLLTDGTFPCTLPSYMVGEWYDSRFIDVEFHGGSNVYLSEYDISRKGKTTNLTCYLSEGNIYVLRTSNTIEDTVSHSTEEYYYYLCMDVTQITEYSFYYYLQTIAHPNTERTIAYNASLTFDSISPFCTTTVGLQLFSVMVRKDYESNALQTCSTPLLGDFNFQLQSTIGTICSSTGIWSFRDEEFTTLNITYTTGDTCTTKIGHSESSHVGCILCINSGTTYYTAIFNLDYPRADVYYARFTCMISETNGDNITLTQRGRLCHEDQNSANPPSTESMYPPIDALDTVGALIHLSPTGESQSSKTADCFPKTQTSSGSSSSNALVIAVVVSLVLLVLLVILLLVILYFCKRKKKEKKGNQGMGSPKKRSFVKQRGSNILVANHETKEKIKIDNDEDGIEGVVTADYQPDVIVGGKSTKIPQNDKKPGFQMTLPNETIMLSENEEKTEHLPVDNEQETTIPNVMDEKQKSQGPIQSQGDARQNQIASKYPANLTPTVWCLTQDSHEEPDKNTDVEKNDVNNDNLNKKPDMLLDKQPETIQDKTKKSDDVNVSTTVGKSKQVIANPETSMTSQAPNQVNKIPEDSANLDLQQKKNKIVINIPNEKIENSEDEAEDPSNERNQEPVNSILLSDEKARYISVHKKGQTKDDAETKEENLNDKTRQIQNDENIKETEHENNDQNFINNQDVDKIKVVHDEKQINNAMNNYHIRHDTGYETLNSSNEINDARPDSNTPNSYPEADNGIDSPVCDKKDIKSGSPLKEDVGKGVNSEIDSLKEHETLSTIEAKNKFNDPDLLTDDFYGTNGKGSDSHASVTPHELRDKQSILSLLLDNECEEHSDSLYNAQNGPHSTDFDSIRQGQHSVKSDNVYRGPPSAELDSLHRGSPFADIDSLHNLQPSVDLDSLHHEQPSADLDSLNNRKPSVDVDSLHNGQSSVYSDNAHHTQHFPQIDNANLKHYTNPDDANLTQSADFDNDDLKRSFDIPYRNDFNMVDLKRSVESMSVVNGMGGESLISSSRMDDQSSVAVSNKTLKDSKSKPTNTHVNQEGKKRTGVPVSIHEKRSNLSSTSVPLHDKKGKTISISVPFNERRSNVSSTPLPVIERKGNTSSTNSNEIASRNHNNLRYERIKTPDEPSDGDETLEKPLYIRNKSTFKKVTPRKFLYLPDIFTIKPLVRSGTMNKSVDARSGTMNKSLDDTDQNVKVQTTSSTHVHVKPTSPSGSSQYEEVEDVNYSPYRAAGWKMGRRRRIGGILDRQPTELPESRVKEKIDVISEMYKPKQKKAEKVKKFPLQSPRIRKARKRLKSVSPMERRKR